MPCEKGITKPTNSIDPSHPAHSAKADLGRHTDFGHFYAPRFERSRPYRLTVVRQSEQTLV